jgi:hypothetical protein
MLHRVLVAVTVLAFLGGTTVQAMPPADLQDVAEQAMQVGMPCDHMTTMASASKTADGHMPCRGITPDCIKQMGCIGFPTLPSTDGLSTQVAYTTLRYRLMQHRLTGLALKPALVPPIAI